VTLTPAAVEGAAGKSAASADPPLTAVVMSTDSTDPSLFVLLLHMTDLLFRRAAVVIASVRSGSHAR
jgi:hypothetical protein